MLVDVFLVVGDDGFGDGLTDGVDLRCVSTTRNSDADVDILELVETSNQEGLVDLESEDLRLDEVERLSVDLDESFTSLFPPCQHSIPPCVFVVSSSLSYLAVCDGGSYSGSVSISLSADWGIHRDRTCLLLAEALYALRGRHDVGDLLTERSCRWRFLEVRFFECSKFASKCGSP